MVGMAEIAAWVALAEIAELAAGYMGSHAPPVLCMGLYCPVSHSYQLLCCLGLSGSAAEHKSRRGGRIHLRTRRQVPEMLLR